MTSHDWVTAALTDDALAAELLLRLNHSPPSQLSSPPPNWGLRQPRSRPPPRKDRDLTRCSPTTPLSWSCGGGSSSSASDGYGESSRPLYRSSSADDRSKGTYTNESTTTSNYKRSRRKKTFSELKEEESLLFNERIHMKKELVALCITLEEQRATSDQLKRIKLDMHLQAANKIGVISEEPKGTISSQSNLIAPYSLHHFSQLPTHAAADFCNTQNGIDTRERCFVLPDLNMTPT